MSAPPSRLALIIEAWLLLRSISKSSEFARGGSAVEVGFDCLLLRRISKSFEFTGVGSALKVGFHCWGLASITKDF